MPCDSTLPNGLPGPDKNIPELFYAFSQICQSIQIVLDTKSRILIFNAAAAETTGYSQEEAMSHAPWELLFDQEYTLQAIRYFQDLPQQQNLLHVSLPIRCKNGETRHIKWRIHSYRAKEDEPRYIIVNGLDITAEINLKNTDIQRFEMLQEELFELQKQNRILQKFSYFDHLTGIYNRRFFDDTLHKTIKEKRHRHTPVSLLMCDVDFFKEYNDTYGHVAGDAVLKKIAQILNEYTRDSDIAARYGGEEFALIFPMTNEQEARNLAKRIQHTIAQAGILHGASPLSPYVTLSIGIATSKPSSLPDARSFVTLADRQLYLAKRSGRNRVVSISHLGSPSAIP